MVSLFLSSCGKGKVEVKPVGELTQYKDPLYNFEISYPKEWTKNCELGTARFYGSSNDINRFADPASGAGKGGVMIKYVTSKIDVGLNEYAKAQKDTMVKENRRVDPEEALKIDGKDAIRIKVTSNYSKKDNALKSYRIYSISDSLLTFIELSAFNDDWDVYQQIFDAVLKTVKLGKAPTASSATSAIELPSDQFDNYQTPYFTVSYPSNFNFSSPPKGTNEFSVELKGQRLDCTIRFDVFPAKGLTVEKVVNQNKAKYNANANPTTLDGTAAQYLNYSQMKNVSSRAYFIVKNDKVIRITLNWFSPESNTYKPVFEKVVNSIKLK
jgi:hypothetical protein